MLGCAQRHGINGLRRIHTERCRKYRTIDHKKILECMVSVMFVDNTYVGIGSHWKPSHLVGGKDPVMKIAEFSCGELLEIGFLLKRFSFYVEGVNTLCSSTEGELSKALVCMDEGFFQVVLNGV